MSFNKIKNEKTIINKFIAWYSTKLQTHPLTTKALTSGVIAGAGDITCQLIVQRRTFYENDSSGSSLLLNKSDQIRNEVSLDKKGFQFEPDLIRTGRFTLLGFALIAPVVHVSFHKVYWT